LKIGAALIPLVGWGIDAEQPEPARRVHLRAIRRLVEEFGLEAVELNGDFTSLYPGVFDRAYYGQVAALQEELGFACTVHLPFLWLDGCSLAEPVREASTQCMARLLESTRALPVESYVVHLWGSWSSILGSVQLLLEEEKRSLLEAMLRSAELTLEELGGLVSPQKLCVENLESLSFEPVVPLLERQGMRICLDVGHLTLRGGDALEFLDRHWGLIGEIHLHDAMLTGSRGAGARDHLPLGRGDVDYGGLMDELRERNFGGVVILEVNTEAALRESLERVGPWL
jgi:sugar phosphate isomerase/epimerase